MYTAVRYNHLRLVKKIPGTEYTTYDGVKRYITDVIKLQ